jgi:K+-transporting ATPase KdpF subunit
MSPTLPLAALSGADVFGLVVSFLVCVYLVYALLRGENL